jgi:uncharacterized protein involved in exopolysaccharide biosynthesis
MIGKDHVAPMTLAEYAGNAQAAPIDLLSMLGAVLRHWKLITAAPLLVLLATYGVLTVVPSFYKSTAEILIYDPQRQIDAAVQKPISPFIDAVDNVAMTTEIEVIKSKSVALRVARDLALDKDPEFQLHSRLSALKEWLGLSQPDRSEGGPQTAGDPDKVNAQGLDRAAGTLLQKLQVKVEKSNRGTFARAKFSCACAVKSNLLFLSNYFRFSVGLGVLVPADEK